MHQQPLLLRQRQLQLPPDIDQMHPPLSVLWLVPRVVLRMRGSRRQLALPGIQLRISVRLTETIHRLMREVECRRKVVQDHSPASSRRQEVLTLAECVERLHRKVTCKVIRKVNHRSGTVIQLRVGDSE